MEPIVEDPPHPVADASAAEVAATADKPAHPTSQRLPGGLLALKLDNHINSKDDTQFDEPSTAGLHIFGNKFIGQGTFGQVFEAQYKGENAVAKVFGSVYTKELKSPKNSAQLQRRSAWMQRDAKWLRQLLSLQTRTSYS